MDGQCAIAGCDKPVRSRNLCGAHYQRGRRSGDLERVKPVGRSGCTVPGCDGLVWGGGLCQMHYQRHRRRGSTDDPRRPAAERFWSKVDKSAGPDGCWPWTGKVNVWGYGVFWFEGREWQAHRWAYMEAHGDVGELSIDHLCRTTRCVNSAHMEPVAIGENILRGYGPAARNARKTHCVNGHPFDAANTQWFGPRREWRRCRKCARLRPAEV